MRESPVVHSVIGAAIEVHRSLGPGLFESAYERALACEFEYRALPFEREAPVPVYYRAANLGCGYRLDFLVKGQVALELKSVDALLPVHDTQVLAYMRLLKLSHGLLINFNVVRLVDGLRSFVLLTRGGAAAGFQPGR